MSKVIAHIRPGTAEEVQLVLPAEGFRLCGKIDPATGTITWKYRDQWRREEYPLDVMETDEDFHERVKQKDIPAEHHATVQVVNTADLPDGDFRQAWRLRLGAVVADIPAAKAVHKARIEARLRAKMADLTERANWGDATAANKIALLKSLRNRLDSDLSSISTIAELKSYIPDSAE